MIERSIGEIFFGFFVWRPIIRTRLVEERGWSICGGAATFGSAAIRVSCSCTSERASRRFVPRSKIRSIRETPGAESDRIVSTPLIPFKRKCSMGTVIRSSTSEAESPRLSVWTSTVGGLTSGTTSTRDLCSCTAPRINRAAAIGSTSSRNRTLEVTSQASMG